MLISKVKRLNTEKLIEFLSEEIQLDEDDLDIIREKKVSGRAFIKLTEDKLEEWGVADGSVLAIVDFVEELRGEECGKYLPCLSTFLYNQRKYYSIIQNLLVCG